MFVTNHALSGALIGPRMAGRPGRAFAAGVVSHLALDAVPHWGCDTSVPDAADRFYTVARRDGILALAAIGLLMAAAEPPTRRATLAAMAGAVVLDVDKPVVHFWGRNPFPRSVQRFHTWVQNESPHGLRNEVASGGLFAALHAMASLRRGTRSRSRSEPVPTCSL